jgi:hypothetical protein
MRSGDVKRAAGVEVLLVTGHSTFTTEWAKLTDEWERVKQPWEQMLAEVNAQRLYQGESISTRVSNL